jgi:hypothetical protein
VDYARDLTNGNIVAAEVASRERPYACRRPGCGGRVYLPQVAIQRPHFRHYPGEGTPACAEYVPGSGSSGEPVAPIVAAVEDVPTELGLILDQFDGVWRVGLRLPEIRHEELGDVSLRDLQPARVEVAAAGAIVTRISALDLRPGVGAARVQVPPTAQEYRSCPAGLWPATIDNLRWDLRSRGLEVRGTLFRFRGGEWTRLLNASGAHCCERLLVLAEARLSPPDSIVTERHAEISGGGLRWVIWEVLLPDEPLDEVTAWLGRLGHEIVPRPWAVEFTTPPRGLDGSGKPTFWIGDLVVLTLAAPRDGMEATLSVKLDTNTHSTSVSAPESRRLDVAIKSPDAKQARICVSAERSATIDVAFVERPSPQSVLNMLAKTRCLRVWLGDQVMEAWRTPTRKVPVAANALPEIRVDFGVESARARVTVWERGRQRSSRGLDARNVARMIEAALPTASRIEVDADNLGRLEIVPTRAAAVSRKTPGTDRLAWYDQVVSLSHPPGHATPAILQRPRAPTSLALRPVGAATLLRSRQALRRRHEAGGDR